MAENSSLQPGTGPAQDRPTQDRSTPRRPRQQPVVEPQAPGPLLALMASLITILLIASWVTGEWGFMILGVFGVAAGLLPLINRR